MNTERFLDNITEQIKEAQLKLGFAKEVIRLYFPDKKPDEWYYCIRMEMGHTIYHRFIEEDYRQLL